ncbi:MAG: alpha/beta fold hydrolase, partial [Proteobacteria bacterium]|nr:alpha/beta fold hydrolase [Pseudomonadota bacterium]
MPTANANDIRIEYDTFGEISDPTLLLIAGLGDQMIMWEEEFCGLLAANGLHVVRFDNRDVGLSSKFDEAGIPNVLEAMNASLRGERIDPPYTLEDMVDDAIGLLDSLKIEKAHICGASMGGAIAQIMAIRHPSRVSSLTSIMSSTGNPDLPEGTPEAGGILVLPMPEEKEAFIEHRLKVQKTIGSPGFPFHEEQARRKAGRVFERSFHPQGTARQHVAIVAHESIKPALASVTA